jgi:predicted nucleotidyltransferase component of viral defense system
MATLIQTLQHILETKDPLLANETKRIILKAAVQAHTLDYLYNHPTYRKLNFYGGFCLHVVYGLNRLSEDLDLDNGDGNDLSHLAEDLLSFFHKTLGYADAAVKTQKGANEILRITLKFPLLAALGLASAPNESLHLKVEVSHHKQTAIIKKTPVFYYGRSIVPAHFSLETMMAGKMIACLERNFQRGREGATLKGRDYFDLLWFMQKQVEPLKEKLSNDGAKKYSTQSAMIALKEKIDGIRKEDLAIDLLPMFESRSFIEAWLDGFHDNFNDSLKFYLGQR